MIRRTSPLVMDRSLLPLKFSADGKSYAYSTLRVLSDLYLVDGLK